MNSFLIPIKLQIMNIRIPQALKQRNPRGKSVLHSSSTTNEPIKTVPTKSLEQAKIIALVNSQRFNTTHYYGVPRT